MKTALRKMGNSLGVIIPAPAIADAAIKTGDSLDVSIEKGRIVLSPVRRNPREGWADDARALALAGDDGLVWPEFANEGDDELEW